MLSGATGQTLRLAHIGVSTRRMGHRIEYARRDRVGYMKKLFAHPKWYDLIPDQTHIVTTAGYDPLSEYVCELAAYLGSYSAPPLSANSFPASNGFQPHFRGSIATNTYSPTARRFRRLARDRLPANEPLRHDRHVETGGAGLPLTGTILRTACNYLVAA